MAKVIKIENQKGIYAFWCEGCQCSHFIAVADNDQNFPVWSFNGDMEKPTVSPSILVKSTDNGVPTVCHSFIRNGKIQYLSDCTHKLAGQTVDLRDFDDLCKF